MKKSKAQLLRDAKSGNLVTEMVYNYGRQIPPALQGKRKIIRSSTVAIYFKNADGIESALWLPASNLLEYTDEHIRIYSAGYRKPTEQEDACLKEWGEVESSDEYKKQSLYDAVTDCSTTYYQKKTFFTNKNMEHLLGFEKVRGLKLDYNRYRECEEFIKDDSIRGELGIEYKIIR